MRKEEVTILEWMIVFVILTIPFVNFIIIIILALGNFNRNIKNFAKALIFFIIFGILLLTFFYGSLGNLLRHIPRYHIQ
ncbi:hypothetical protein KHQ81_09365 [Mycoplasmatota bacterium]|nr:hypothetical protein KHQ81_09365 [Mycoplasmatota bacterium]